MNVIKNCRRKFLCVVPYLAMSVNYKYHKPLREIFFQLHKNYISQNASVSSQAVVVKHGVSALLISFTNNVGII